MTSQSQSPVPSSSPSPAPRLWDPEATAWWSLLFSPIFGMCLHAWNWRELGETRRARLAWEGLAVMVVLLLFVSYRLVSVGKLPVHRFPLLAAHAVYFWYLSMAGIQLRHLHKSFGKTGYTRRSLAVPIALSSFCLMGYLTALLLAIFVAGPSLTNISSRAEVTLREVWSEQQDLQGLVVLDVRLQEKRGSLYRGYIDIADGAETIRYELEVTWHLGDLTFRLGEPIVDPGVGNPAAGAQPSRPPG